MIKIEIDQVVRDQLRAAFPRARAADDAIDKYQALLALHINSAMASGDGNLVTRFFSLAAKKITDTGPKLTAKSIRLEKWLAKNNLVVLSREEPGNSHTGEISLCKLTELATIKNEFSEKTQTEFTEEEAAENIKSLEFISPGLTRATAEQLAEEYDSVEVNIAGLDEYAAWLIHDAKNLSIGVRRQYKAQVEIVRLHVAVMGAWYQKKKESAFGRTYYSGVSIQSVNKELRRSILGDCWEYDIGGAVFAFKLGWAEELCDAKGWNLRRKFAGTLRYLEDKSGFLATCLAEVFDSSSSLTAEEQKKMIKTAITAIGFGARHNVEGYWAGSQWEPAALADLFGKLLAEYARFNESVTIKAIAAEGNLVDKFILAECKRTQHEVLGRKEVRGKRGRLNTSKLVAWLYQHIETLAMDAVALEVERQGGVVKARIHDAIFVDRIMDIGLLDDVMQQASGVKHFMFKQERLEGYKRS
jgi:hypothetical protein